MSEIKILRTSKLTITKIDYSDGTSEITEEYNGFKAYELIGILATLKDQQIIKAIESKEKNKTTNQP